MTSRLLDPAKQAYVWTWLPGAATPVVAGRIEVINRIHHFTYGQSYLQRANDAGREANQALRICGESRQSRVALAVEAAPKFGLTERQAEDMVVEQVEVIRSHLAALVEEAELTQVDRQQLANRAILNAYAFEGASARIAALDHLL